MRNLQAQPFDSRHRWRDSLEHLQDRFKGYQEGWRTDILHGMDTKEEQMMKFKCPYCGTIKEMSAFKVLFELMLHHNLRVWCDRCFCSTHWHLKLWRGDYIRKEVKLARLEKKQ